MERLKETNIYIPKIKERKFKCAFCGKEVKSNTSLLPHESFCDEKCKKKFEEKYPKINKCLYCKKDFHARKSDTKFCSYFCKYNYSKENASIYNYICDNCLKPFQTKSKKHNKRKFCSWECYQEFDNKRNAKQKGVCEICGEEFIKDYPKQRFCSTQCQAKWQSLIKKRAKMPQQSSKIEITIRDFLDKNKIKYEANKRFKYYEIDIYLSEYNLGIEIMGEYWHGESRKYEFINNIQGENIRRDKRKKTFIKNKYGFNILYLWEFDIKNNIELCEKLIFKYINNKGNLKNYHSSDYIFSNKKLKLKKNKNKQYMDVSSNKLKSIIKDKRKIKK